MMDFEDFLCEKNDQLDSKAYELLLALAIPSVDADDQENWIERLQNMDLIGPLLDCAEEILQKAGYQPCRPYFDGDEDPCCKLTECSRTDCPCRN